MKLRRPAVVLLLAGSAAAAFVVASRLRTPPSEVRADEPAKLEPEPPIEDPWAHETTPVPVPGYVRFETIGVEDGLPCERTTCVLAEGDDLYVGTEEGFAERRGGKWRAWRVEDGLPHGFVTSVARDAAGDVTWLGTLRGVVRLAGGRPEVMTQRTSGLMNDVVYHVVTDGPRVWFGTASGTSVLDTRSGAWSSFDHENSILHEPWCYAIALGRGRAWIGIWGGGIGELDRRTGTWKEYRDPDGEMEIDLLADDGPIHDVSSFVAYDDGRLWQASYFGISRYDGRRWATWTAKDQGLAGDFVTHLAARGDACWVSTDQGLSVVQGDVVTTYLRQEDGTCRVRTVRAGQETETRTLATAPADGVVAWAFPRDGEVWLATARGLSRGITEARTR